MKQRNSYSRFLQNLVCWEKATWGEKLKCFHHCIEKDITSFLAISPGGETLQGDSIGEALSESGLSRDEIQLLGGTHLVPENSEALVRDVEQTLMNLRTDYLDLLFLNLSAPPEVIMPAVERLVSQGKIIETGVFDVDSFSAPARGTANSVKAILSQLGPSDLAKKPIPRDASTSENLTKILWIDAGEMDVPKKSITDITEKYNCTAPILILAWLLHHPTHFHLAIEQASLGTVDAAVQAQSIPLLNEDWKKISETLTKFKDEKFQ